MDKAMATTTTTAAPIDAPAAAAFEVRSSWQAIQGQIDSVLDVVISDSDDDDPGADPSAAAVAVPGDLGVLSLAPLADSPGPCEITVEFQHRLCHPESISILGSCRKCEMYSQLQPSGDFEYICTARGTLEDEEQGSGECQQEREGRSSSRSSGRFYEAEIELVNAHAWAAVKLRLLSLENSSRVDVKRITIRARAGEARPPALVDEQGSSSSSNSSSNSSSLLTMLMPSVLQIVRGMSDGIDSRRTAAAAAAQAQPQRKIEAAAPASKPPAEASQRDGETSFRLQRLEMAIGRMEVFLQGAFSKLDERMSGIEVQISTLQQQQQQQYRELGESVLAQKTSQPVLVDTTPEVLRDASEEQVRGVDDGDDQKDGDRNGNRDNDDDQDDDGEEDDEEAAEKEESSPSMSGSVSEDDGDDDGGDDDGPGESSSESLEPGGQRGSMTLEDAWASALAAFSVSVVPVPTPAENTTADAFEDAVAEVNAERADERKEECAGIREAEAEGGEGGGGGIVEVEEGSAAPTAEEAEAATLVEQQGSDDDPPAAAPACSEDIDLIDFVEVEVQVTSSSRGDDLSPDSVLIDCIDGAYMMRQQEQERKDKGSGNVSVVDNGFDLTALPVVDPETLLI